MPGPGSKIVQVPGMGNVEFPGDMGDEDIGRIIAGQQRPNFAANPPGIPKPVYDPTSAQNPVQGAGREDILGPIPDTLYSRIGSRIKQNLNLPAQIPAVADMVSGAIKQGIGQPPTWQEFNQKVLQPFYQQYKGKPENILGDVATAAIASGGDVNLGIGAMRDASASAKFIPRLLNASGEIAPETLQNLATAEPALRAGGRPTQFTQEGMAAHVRKLSTNIDSQIAPVIKQAASKDVSASTAQIAQNLRDEITPEMKDVNPGTANILEKFAKSAENSKTLGSLDELRKQLNDRRYAVKPNAIVRPYISKALDDVLDAIAGHAQQIRPDLPVRSLRSQQAALMKLGDTFEGSAAKGQAQVASRQGLTTGQKIGQKLPELIQAATNPKAALAKKLVQPSTSEQLLRQAYRGPQTVTRPTPAVPFPEEQLNAIREGGAETRRSSAEFMQDVIRRQGLPADPQLADIEAAVKGRAAEMAQKYPVPQYQSIRDPFAPPQTPADVYNPQVVQQHASAMEQAKSELGGNASLSEILQRAAKIQRGGQ